MKLSMKQLLNVWPLLAFIFGQSISYYPELTFRYESDSEQYSMEELSIQDYELTITGQYTSKKLNILTRMGYHLIDGMNGDPSDFSREQGLHWYEYSPGIGTDQKNYYIVDMKLQYGDSTSYLYFNKWNQHWGPGVNSLTISNKVPNFFHFGFEWQLTKKIHFKYFHGKLKSEIIDESYTDDYIDNDGGARKFDIIRNIAGHRLEWQPHKQIIISGSELITYANRDIEFAYMLPFIPFFPIQTYVGETDNVIMSGDIQYFPREDIIMYGVLIVDEWSPPVTFDNKENRNWFGWQLGFSWRDILFSESRLRIEYTWTDHRIYRHRFNVNDFYSYGYPVGFWAGPHAEEFYIDYKFVMGENYCNFMYSDAKRGQLTEEMIINQYNSEYIERFSEDTENKQVYKFTLRRKINKNVNLSCSYTYVDWENSGGRFNSESSELIINKGHDINKHSFGFGLGFKY